MSAALVEHAGCRVPGGRVVVVVFHLQWGESVRVQHGQGTEAYTVPAWETLGTGSSVSVYPCSDALSSQLCTCSYTKLIPSGHMQGNEERVFLRKGF